MNRVAYTQDDPGILIGFRQKKNYCVYLLTVLAVRDSLSRLVGSLAVVRKDRFSSTLRLDLLSLQGDIGVRELLCRHKN